MKKILVVEDNRDMSVILRKRLESDGFSVDVVAGGYSMVGYLKEAKEPDAVILDLMIPETSGIELLNVIKCAWDRAKIFVFSALPESNVKYSLKHYDICGFFRKMDGIDNLIDAIKKELNG